MLSRNKYLSDQEQACLEASLSRHRFDDLRGTTMLLLMLKCGLRPSEVVNLNWSDVDWSRATIFVKTLKGGSERVLPLSQELVNRLSALGEAGGPIFPITYKTFQRAWYKYRPTKRGLHSLRHTFAINLLKARCDLKLIQKALGHKFFSTTEVYLDMQVSVEDLRKVMNG